MFLKACAAKTELQKCAAGKACLGAFTKSGPSSSWVNVYVDGKRRLAGDTARAATTDEVKDLSREVRDLKEVVAEQTLERRFLKKSMIDGGANS